MPVNSQNQNDDVPAKFEVHLAADQDRRFVAGMDEVTFTAHVIPDGNGFAAIMDGLELEDADGNAFIAIVNGMDLEGKGSAARRAQDDLIRAMRSWLERQDTAGKLADVLGIVELAEDAEVTLQFVDLAEAAQRRSGMVTTRPPPADIAYPAEAERVSVFTFRG